ncbi:MAG: hypothetical protein JW854_11490 [Actinobacteria bacterium]|nr:hypothetical protein [Actinomycetota bacterium]
MEAMAAGAGFSARTALAMIVNPAKVVKSALERVPWPVSLSVSGLAFTLLFLQTGLDMHRVGTASAGTVVGFTFLGLAMGTAGMALVAALAWAVSRLLGGGCPLDWIIKAFCLAYTPALIFVSLGFIFNLSAGWNTAVAFGVTGVMWALMPLNAVLREMTGERLGVSLALSTLCGGLVLGAWALLGI